MGIDPVVIQNVAQNMRAEIMPRVQPMRLDPVIVDKIARKVPIFNGMSMACLMSTLGDAEHVPLKTGQSVFQEGERGRFFFVLIAGNVVVEKMRDGRAYELARLGPGECFGEMALVGKQVRSASVRALNEVIAMRFDPLLIEANPEGAHIIYRNIAHILASRLDDSSMMLADLAALRFDKPLPP